MNRRDFVKLSIAAGASVLTAGALLGGCSGTRRSDLPPEGGGRAAGVPLDPDAAAILRHASLAPSGHNAQPWIVTVDRPLVWTIGLDPARRLPEVDPTCREALLSIGAFVENLVISAEALGYRVRTEVVAAGMQDTDILRVRLEKAPVRPYPLQRLELRRTVKHGHGSRELKAETVRVLAAPLDGRLFYFPRSSEHARCIAEGTAAAFEEQTRRDSAQKELAAWTRFSRRSAAAHRDGLTTEGMEITGLGGWYVRSFMTPADVMGESWRNKGIEMMKQMTLEGAGWFVVTSAGSSVADLMDTGRRFQRMALLAREQGVAIHPMTQMLEEDTWRRRIAAEHAADMTPQFILRVGYLDRYPEPVSLRRPVSWFVRGGQEG
jgi:hypothetical protein